MKLDDPKPERPENSIEFRDSLTWQLEQYHHIQTQSRGAITLFLTVLAITLSVYFSLIHPIPSIDPSTADMVQAIGNLPIGIVTASVTLLMSLILSFAFFSYAIYCGGLAFTKLLTNTLNKRLKVGIDPTRISITELYPHSRKTRYSGFEYATQLKRNHEYIEDAQRLFVSGSIRGIVAIFGFFNAYQLFVLALELNYATLLLMNFAFFVPFTVVLYVVNKMYSIYSFGDSEALVSDSVTDDDHYIFGHLTESLTDYIFGAILIVLPLFVLLSWVGSLLLRFT